MMSVYFVEAVETGWIKIGYSKRSIDRIAGSNTFCPHELKLLKVIEGERDVECAWHRRFKHRRGMRGMVQGLHLSSWKRSRVRPPPEHAERVPEEASKRKLRGHRVRALEDRARRDDASEWAILQGWAELSRVQPHRETIGVLIHRAG
jgi:hypothetical protein